MGAGSLIVVSLTVFVMFTAIMGAGLIFYQEHLALEPETLVTGDSTAVLINQGGALLILILFLLSGLFFFAGAVRWVSVHR